MANAFEMASAAIFYDGNMSVEATFKRAGSSDLPIRVIKSTSRDDPDFGDTSLVNEKTIIDIQKSDVERPKIGDQIVIDGVIHEIYATPMLDSLSIVWTCDVRS